MRAPMARPAPTESPWPSEPVAASTPGMRGVGWPSSSLENCAQGHQARDREHSGFGQRGIENRRGMALRQHEAVAVMRIGILGIEFHGVEKSPATSSAADMQEVGWPEPAAVVAIIEKMLRRRAFSLIDCTAEAAGTAEGVAVIRAPCGDNIEMQSYPVRRSPKMSFFSSSAGEANLKDELIFCERKRRVSCEISRERNKWTQSRLL